MLITKFPATFTAAFLVPPCAPAQTKTRLPEAGVTASPDEAQGHAQLVTSTGKKTDTPLCDLSVSVVVIPKEAWRAQSALPLDNAIYYAPGHSLFDMFPLPRLRAALFVNC